MNEFTERLKECEKLMAAIENKHKNNRKTKTPRERTLQPGDQVAGQVFAIVSGKVYGVCYGCGKIVRINKPLIGSAHLCLSSEEIQLVKQSEAAKNVIQGEIARSEAMLKEWNRTG